jgi:hypothetical protein
MASFDEPIFLSTEKGSAHESPRTREWGTIGQNIFDNSAPIVSLPMRFLILSEVNTTGDQKAALKCLVNKT